MGPHLLRDYDQPNEGDESGQRGKYVPGGASELAQQEPPVEPLGDLGRPPRPAPDAQAGDRWRH